MEYNIHTIFIGEQLYIMTYNKICDIYESYLANNNKPVNATNAWFIHGILQLCKKVKGDSNTSE